jgi:hypothetical protein
MFHCHRTIYLVPVFPLIIICNSANETGPVSPQSPETEREGVEERETRDQNRKHKLYTFIL